MNPPEEGDDIGSAALDEIHKELLAKKFEKKGKAPPGIKGKEGSPPSIPSPSTKSPAVKPGSDPVADVEVEPTKDGDAPNDEPMPHSGGSDSEKIQNFMKMMRPKSKSKR